MKLLLKLALALSSLALFASCDAFKAEYGEPEAQFYEAMLPQKGDAFLRKKITVKGTVTRHDLSDPKNCMLYLGYGIQCNFRDKKEMVESYRLGATVFVDGILRSCTPREVLLDPAVGRDPTAKFEPVQ